MSLMQPPLPPPGRLKGTPPPSAPRPAFALWALGFRPLYLLASLYAALSIPLWALSFGGWLGMARHPHWHAQEMVFGFALAIVVGFLFTAGQNWSGRPTPSGRALQAVVSLWVAGRVLAYTPWAPAAMVADAAFVATAAAGLGRALVAGGNRRNYFFIGVLVAMGLAHALAQAVTSGLMAYPSAAPVLQLGLDLMLFVMAVMGGRVIPMFSNNGAPGTDARRDPRLERLALGSIVVLAGADLLGWPPAVGVPVLIVAFVAHAARLVLWHPLRTRRVPLVWVLHAAYGWIVLHLLLRAAAQADWVSMSVANHALTVGGIGALTLGMMTRTARGHTGRPLRAEGAEVAMFVLVLLAAAIRVLVPLAHPPALLHAIVVSAVLWSGAYGLYAWRYGPWLMRARADGRPG